MKITKNGYVKRTTRINEEINKMEQTKIIALANQLRERRLMKSQKKREGITYVNEFSSSIDRNKFD